MDNDLIRKNYQIFARLMRDMDNLTEEHASIVEQSGVYYDYLFGDIDSCRISLSQLHIHHGETVINPSVEFILDRRDSTLTAVTYEDLDHYYETYDREGRPKRIWQPVNEKITLWLEQLQSQGYSLAPTAESRPDTVELGENQAHPRL